LYVGFPKGDVTQFTKRPKRRSRAPPGVRAHDEILNAVSVEYGQQIFEVGAHQRRAMQGIEG
jgi:hypothetical protein